MLLRFARMVGYVQQLDAVGPSYPYFIDIVEHLSVFDARIQNGAHFMTVYMIKELDRLKTIMAILGLAVDFLLIGCSWLEDVAPP